MDHRIRLFSNTWEFNEFIDILGMMSLIGKLVSGMLMACDAGSQQLPFLAIRAAHMCTSHLQCDDRFATARFSDLDIVQIQTS